MTGEVWMINGKEKYGMSAYPLHLKSGEKQRARFLRVKCSGCENEQLVFSHASSVVRCNVCGKTLAVPHGGKAEIKTTIINVVE